MTSLALMKSFISTIEEGSFTAAARQLNVSKSLVSRHVRELEADLSTRLMNRSTKALSLTDAGRLYYEEARLLIEKLDDLNSSMRAGSNSISGALNILAPNGLTEILLMPFICQFNQAHPQLQINLRLNDNINDLASEGYDVAIRSGSLIDKDLGLIAQSISRTQNIMCTSPRYLATRSAPTEPSDLAHHLLIQDVNLTKDNTWVFSNDEEQQSVTIEPSITVNSIQAVKQILHQGHGIAMLPKELARDELDKGEFVSLLTDYQLPHRKIYALYPARKHTPKKVKVFIDELKKYFSCSV